MSKFTKQCSQSLISAGEISRKSGKSHVATEHLLWGIMQKGFIAANILAKLGIDRQTVQAGIESSAQITAATESEPIPAEDTKRAIGAAVAFSRSRGDEFVGTGHFLLGLLTQEDSEAARILKSLSVSEESVREEIRAMVSESAEPITEPFSTS